MTAYGTLIEVDDLASLIDGGNLRVVDCRFDLMRPAQGRVDYLAGHIPGAIYADLDRDLAGPVTPSSGRHPLPDPDDFISLASGWGIGDATQVVVYDQASGALAARLWWMLRWVGHDRVAVLDGGLDAWIQSGLPLETSQPAFAEAHLTGNVQAEMIATLDDVVAAVSGHHDMTVIDARDPARFAGRSEPIDAVAGHVPGAVNLPFVLNLAEGGRWKSPDDIRHAWENRLGERLNGPLAAMCGSGVTACHLALAAVVAGIDEPRVFVGSWSEWIRDPSRPVAAEP